MNILSMAENKNPADADGDTPLNKTDVQGKINLVKFIIESITEKKWKILQCPDEMISW